MSKFLFKDDDQYGMAAHSFQDGGDDCVTLPNIVPFDLSCLTRLSWELGSRVVDDDESTLHSRWEHRSQSQTLSIFRVTSNTIIMCVQTPVGRERFYGTTQSDLKSAVPNLIASSYW